MREKLRLTLQLQLLVWSVSDTAGNTRRSLNAGLLLVQRRRRWPNIKPTLGERLVLIWIYPSFYNTLVQPFLQLM